MSCLFALLLLFVNTSTSLSTRKEFNNGTAFLPDWMGHIMPAIENASILDLSLPGTHDTMTYDLDLIVSDGGIDDEDKISDLLQYITDHYPNAPLDYVLKIVRDLATTQLLNVTSALNSGIRFLDFRTMREEHEDDWRCLHLLQTKELSRKYFHHIRDWIEEHDTEIVIIWISKHGNDNSRGTDQYPDVTVKEKQRYWNNITEIFKGRLFDKSISSLKDTPIKTLLERKHNVVILASDYAEFTSNSTLALDTRVMMDNDLTGNYPLNNSRESNLNSFQNGKIHRAADASEGKFWLRSQSGEGPDVTMKDITELHLAGQGTEKYETECAESFGIPNMTKWCPDTLLQQSQLHNYYLQRDLEDAYQNIKQGKDSWDFPHAFYLDAADTDGGIRVGTAESGFGPSEVTCAHVLWTDCTGSQPKCPEGYVGTGEKDHWNLYDTDGTKHDFCVVPWHNHYRCCETPSSEIGTSLFHTSDLSKVVRPNNNNNNNNNTGTAKYGYVDTLIASNVIRICGHETILRTGLVTQNEPTPCEAALALAEERRRRHPLFLWDDPDAGRLIDWPN